MDEDTLGLQGMARGDQDGIVALPVLKTWIEIHREQREALFEQDAGISVRKIIG
jgi:hypothetical protein